MKLTFITNACCIVEAQGFRLLSDPWLVPGAFGTWTHDPPLRTRPEDVADVDALYISHVHPDHLCPATLASFRKDVPVVTLKDKLGITERKLGELGFTQVFALPERASAGRFPFRFTLFAPFTAHPFHGDDCELGNVLDSAMLIEADGQRILNTNDNTPDVEAAEWLRRDYGPFDVVQLNWNNAGPYPACFDNLSHDEKLSEASRILERNLAHMAAVAKVLGAKYTMPFAGQYKLGFGMEHLNQYLGTCPAREACAYLENAGIRPLYLEEGQSLDLS